MITDCRELKRIKLEELKNKVLELQSAPCLCVVQVGSLDASNTYVRNKKNAAEKLGYRFRHIVVPEESSTEDLIREIEKLNMDSSVDGIILQLPIPKSMDSTLAVNSIAPEKDVDGLTYVNQGKLFQGLDGFIPCTPKGVMDILDSYHVPLEGRNAVILGRSILVGKPMGMLLMERNATVCYTHSKTKNLAEITKNADILVSAIGRPLFVTEDMVKENAIIIDVGINRVEGKLCGDVDFEKVEKKSSLITPVPGGVGQMTVYELMENTYEAHLKRTLK